MEEQAPIVFEEEPQRVKLSKFKNRRSNLCFKEVKVEINDEDIIDNSPESVKEEVKNPELSVVYQPPLLP